MTLKIRNLKQRSNSLIKEHDVTTAKVFATFQTVKICPLMKAHVIYLETGDYAHKSNAAKCNAEAKREVRHFVLEKKVT